MSVCNRGVDQPHEAFTLPFPWRSTQIRCQWGDDTVANATGQPLHTNHVLSCFLGLRADSGEEAAWDFPWLISMLQRPRALSVLISPLPETPRYGVQAPAMHPVAKTGNAHGTSGLKRNAQKRPQFLFLNQD